MATFNNGDPVGPVDVSRNHYDVLEVNARTATPADIKRSFRRLCLKYHPDKSGPDALGRFQDIKVAHDVLSDPLKKAKFDHIFFYSRGAVPYNAKRIAEPSDSQPSSKRPRLEPGAADGQQQPQSSAASPVRPESSVEGNVSPPSEADGGSNVEARLASLSIPELKALARDRGVNITFCLEKSDMVKAIKRGPVPPAPQPTAPNNVASSPQSSKAAVNQTSSPLLSQYWAYEREAALRQQWLGVSNEGLNASTGLYEWISWLRRVIDSSVAYVASAAEDVRGMQDKAEEKRNKIGSESGVAGRANPPAGKFSRALEAHRRMLSTSLATFRRTNMVLSKLNEDLTTTARALKTTDAGLVVAGRQMAGEIKALKESATRIATSPDLMAEAQRYSEAKKNACRPPAGAAAAPKEGVYQGVGSGQQPPPSASSVWNPSAAAPGSVPHIAPKQKNAVDHGVDQSRTSSAEQGKDWGQQEGDKQGTVKKDGGVSVGATVPPSTDNAAAEEATVPPGAARVSEAPSAAPTSSDSAVGRVTVRIPDNWQPGSKVKFNTGRGAIRFMPPSGCHPGDLMEYDPQSRKIKQIQAAAAEPAAATAPPVQS
ncbi:hypothetical protein FOZ62_032256 [Perkinsus olseni]|uniref:J domain-containing protein n=1 Tax=Perkinsus olseni TaxID=32597 RepID=A0A7J6QS82_PEROL|nr:hypothetical protein FOZ62_032256 [Perkinsus olseni]